MVIQLSYFTFKFVDFFLDLKVKQVLKESRAGLGVKIDEKITQKLLELKLTKRDEI
jgi:hypothetical protein